MLFDCVMVRDLYTAGLLSAPKSTTLTSSGLYESTC